ncbi:PREDICTED: cytochrome P450 86B1-like [Nelumbo nucifera]|uniref:Cytochrome P450 86B1-like n=1 Tax=Nelumbo nucifera TaxID=4432 RepID=A0A1U8B3T3_NELNU|nr:PREDICTED: cytochrome P450 86B1-like [Nelumbo nucifera]
MVSNEFAASISGYQFFLLAILSAVFFLRWFLFFKQKLKNQVIPEWPLLGSLPSVARNFRRLSDWFTEVFLTLGTKTFYLKGLFSKLDYVITCDPHNFEYMLKVNTANYPKGEDFRQIFDILGEGIFNTDFESWATQRKASHSAFRLIEFRSFVSHTVQKLIDEKLLPLLANVAREGSAIDLQDLILRFTFDSIAITTWGKDLGLLSQELPATVAVQAIDDAQEAIICRNFIPTLIWKLMRLLKIGSEKKMAKAWEVADNIILDIILEKKEQLLNGTDESGKNSLLSIFIRSQGQENDWSKSRMKYLRDMSLNFIIAGRDTTASGLVWFFWSVSRNPHVEEKLLEELKLAFAKKKGNGEGKKPWVFDSEDLKELVYLHAAICESLRLYPPVHTQKKSPMKEDIFPDGTTVKPGMQILLSNYALARMPSVWGKDCLKFKPERWIREDGTLNNEMISKLLFAFGTGPRTCLGKDMAFTQMKMAAAAVLFNYSIQVVEGHPVSLKQSVILEMKDGLMVNVKERDSWCQ